MIIRLVKLRFKSGNEEAFISLFRSVEQQIKSFPGCKELKVWRDSNNSSIFFTHSIWQDEAALEKYRISGFFLEFWPKAKALFSAPAEAWSLYQFSIDKSY